jgi:hypothetical protein
MIEQPLVVDRKDGCILVRMHWSRFRVECDLDKFEVRQTLCDSGSTITILIAPKKEVGKKASKRARKTPDGVVEKMEKSFDDLHKRMSGERAY